MDFIVVLFAAIIGDLIWGNKKNFSERLNYPVIVFRRFIDFIDREFNKDEFSDNTKVFNGTIITLMAIIILWFLAIILEKILFGNFVGNILIGFFVSLFLNIKSSFNEIKAIYNNFMDDDIDQAKEGLGSISSVDCSELNESEITALAIDNLFRKLMLHFVCPFFWLFIMGLPGLLISNFISYANKLTLQTAPKYQLFGKFISYLENIMYYIPSRLTSLLIILSSLILKEDWKKAITITRQYSKEMGPVSLGWSSASIAGALNIIINVYNTNTENDEFFVINPDGIQLINFDYIMKGIWIYIVSISLFLVGIFFGSIV